MPQDTVVSHSETSLDNRSNEDLFQDVQENQIDLIELAILLLQGKKTILRCMLASIVVTAIVVFGVMKPMYKAEATFLPPQTAPGSGMAQLASQLGSLGALGALSG